MTPVLFRQSLMGRPDFDPLRNLFGSLSDMGTGDSYPACNIEKQGDENYSITLVVAGFDKRELRVSMQDNRIVVAGQKERTTEKTTGFLCKEIPSDFERVFQLGDYMRVTGADLKNGLLRIEVVREVPEELKPRRIEIKASEAQPRLQSSDRERAA